MIRVRWSIIGLSMGTSLWTVVNILSNTPSAWADSIVGNPPPSPATAVARPPSSNPSDSLNNVFLRAFNNSTGRYFDSTSISGQANGIFGWRDFPGSFFDNQITSDAELVNAVYTDALQQQSGGKLVRSRDLTNPFDTSIQQNPDFVRTGGAASGSLAGGAR